MSKTVRVACIGVLVVLACLAAQPLRAQTVLISNLPGNDATQSADLDELRNKGMGFTMPAGPNYILNHVTLRLATFGAVQPRVELWSNVGSLPGAMIEVLTNPTFNPSGTASYDFTSPSGTTILTAGTGYWIVAYGVAGAAIYDWKASTPPQNPTGLATHLGSLFDTNGPPPTTNSTIICSYSVTGTQVPVELMGLSIE